MKRHHREQLQKKQKSTCDIRSEHNKLHGLKKTPRQNKHRRRRTAQTIIHCDIRSDTSFLHGVENEVDARQKEYGTCEWPTPERKWQCQEPQPPRFSADKKKTSVQEM